MTVLEIIEKGNPILNQNAEAVKLEEINTNKIQQIVFIFQVSDYYHNK